MLRLAEFQQLLQVTGLPETAFLDLVLASGAGFVQYNAFLDWLCSGYVFDDSASQREQQAKLEIDQLKLEIQELQANNDQLLVQRKLSKHTDGGMSAEEQYKEAFLSVGGQPALNACYSEYIEISRLVKEQDIKSPWQQDSIYQGLSSSVLLHDARLALPAFERACDALKNSATKEGLDVSVLMAPLKGLVRSNTKVQVKYAGDLTQLSDICRATLRVSVKRKADGQDDDTLKRIYTFMKKFVRCPPKGVVVTHYHDRYQHPMWGGYRDFLFIICVRGMFCELQINIDALLAVKEGAGHDKYEVERLHNDLMLEAAQMNDASALGQHLKKGARPDYKTGVGFSPLSYAALHDNPSMASSLLKKKANPFKADSTGQIPLSRAVKQGKFSVSKVLINAMVDAASDGPTRVLAKKEAHLSCISIWALLYIMSNPDLNLNNDADTALELFKSFDKVFVRVTGGMDLALADAVMANLSFECETLIEANAQINRTIVKGANRHRILDLAASSGSTATVRTLLKHGAHTLHLYERDGEEYEKMKMRIIKHDLSGHLEAFLEASPNWLDVNDLLCLSVSKGYSEDRKNGKLNIAKTLLQRGASAAQLNPSQLAVLVESLVFEQDRDMLHFLLMQKTSFDDNSFKGCGRAVLAAAKLGFGSIIQILAEVGCPLDEPDEESGSTAMHLAARGGHTSAMRILHACGCIIDGNNTDGRTPASEAAINGQIQVLQALKDMDCDLTVAEGCDRRESHTDSRSKRDPSWDRTLVHVAAMAGESETIQWLASNGCDINRKAVCLRNNTPLHCAAESCANEAFERLLHLKADPDVVNDDNMTPLDTLKHSNMTHNKVRLSTVPTLSQNILQLHRITKCDDPDEQ